MRAGRQSSLEPSRCASPRFAFRETDYYTADDGPRADQMLLGLRAAPRSGRIERVETAGHSLGGRICRAGRHAEPRPLNLDPGYITLAKLVLASTKDHAHRIYLGQGIFAEVTLLFQRRPLAASRLDVSGLSPGRLS